MRRRRRLDSSSSLDLFLDTICNAFGGIMFITILVAVVLQTRKYAASQTPSGASQRVEYERLAKSIDRTKRLLQDMMESEKTIQEGPLGELVQQAEKAENDVEQLAERNEQTLKEIAMQMQENAKKRSDLETLTTSLKLAREATQERESELDAQTQGRTKFLNLPVVKTSNKRNILLLMRYGKIYLVQEVRGGKPSWYSKHVQVNGDGASVRPIENEGWQLDRSGDKIELNRLLASQKSTEFIVSVGVWSDSFEKLPPLKQVLIDSGFEYELFPVADVDAISIGTAVDSPKVQ